MKILIAILSIWIGVGVSAFGNQEIPNIAYCAMMSTMIISFLNLIMD
jgi:hypothetical protein